MTIYLYFTPQCTLMPHDSYRQKKVSLKQGKTPEQNNKHNNLATFDLVLKFIFSLVILEKTRGIAKALTSFGIMQKL